MGRPCPKAEALFFRFATRGIFLNIDTTIDLISKDDQKVLGASIDSHYYREHGNPNFDMLKGLISSSRYTVLMSRNVVVITVQTQSHG